MRDCSGKQQDPSGAREPGENVNMIHYGAEGRAWQGGWPEVGLARLDHFSRL